MNIHASQNLNGGKEGTGGFSFFDGSQNDDKPPRLSLWKAENFEQLVAAWVDHKGSHYERKHGLKPRCVYGELQNSDFGTITYYTDDGRIGLIWAFRRGRSWVAIYPTAAQFDYFYKTAPQHIAAVLTNNKKEYKLVGV